MSDSGAGTGEGAVEAVRWRIARWRQERERLGPMPEDLWAAAVGLARVHGVFRVARGLPVDYGALKKRVDGACGSWERETRGGFVELPVPAPVAGVDGATVEMVGSDGARVVVRLPATHGLDLAALLSAFLSTGTSSASRARTSSAITSG